MKYIAVVKQAGYGCDYTINCGLDVIELKGAKSNFEAVQLLKEIMFNEEHPQYRGFEGEQSLDSIKIYAYYSASPIDVDADFLYKERENELKVEKLKEENQKEYEEYLKLKEKFDGK